MRFRHMPGGRMVRNLRRDTRGLAAVEFAVILPIVLMLFLGTIGVSTGVAVDRKVIILTRTLSDLISQAQSVSSVDTTNAFNMASAVMAPYSSTPVQAKISQIYIDPSTLAAKVKWSAASNATARGCNEIVTTLVPSGIRIGGTYLIMSEVAYDFTPVAGMNGGAFSPPTFHLNDTTFTRPRQTDSVTNTSAATCN